MSQTEASTDHTSGFIIIIIIITMEKSYQNKKNRLKNTRSEKGKIWQIDAIAELFPWHMKSCE